MTFLNQILIPGGKAGFAKDVHHGVTQNQAHIPKVAGILLAVPLHQSSAVQVNHPNIYFWVDLSVCAFSSTARIVILSLSILADIVNSIDLQ